MDGTMKQDEQNKDKMQNSDEAEICAPRLPSPIEGFTNFGHVALQGVLNNRDLGGFPTANGKFFKRRRLIRSGDLHHATSTDLNQLINMHDMECIVDLRSSTEIEASPDPLPLLQGIEYVHLEVLTPDDIVSVAHLNAGQDMTLVREFMGSPYETITDLYSKALLGESGMKSYSQFLEMLLASEEGAILWHCTQGKDRTGIAAILVESALGASEVDIRRDYLATNLFISGWIARMKEFLANRKIAQGIENDIDAYAYASPCYFEEVFRIVNEMFGSISGYMKDALDFDEDKCRKLQELYLV